ncbi:MAG: hypothetical protein ACE5D8_09270 [Fidelibacterota bacterium]
MRYVYPIVFLTPVIIFCQLQLSVPAHVFQVSTRQSWQTGTWIGPQGQSGIKGQSFQIQDYGKQYFDQDFLIDGYYASPYDLYDLDSLFATSSFTVGNIMRTFNAVTAPLYGLDSLPDYSTDFFTGPITVGGTFDLSRTITTSQTIIRIVYGTTDRINWTIELPVIHRTLRQSGTWHGDPVSADGDWLSYHQAAKTGLETILDNTALISNGDGIWPLLQVVYDKFYTWDSPNSVLWALEGGNDPVGNGIFGQDYNPFAANDTSRITIDDLFNFYYPRQITRQGFSDFSVEFKFLVAGEPSWRNPTTRFELYTGFQLILPLGQTQGSYLMDTVFPEPITQEFQIPLGTGVTQFKPFVLFGFNTIRGMRRWELSNRLSFGMATKESLNTSLVFFPTQIWYPDTLINQIGKKYYYRRGYEINNTFRSVFTLGSGFLDGLIYGNIYWKSRDYYWSAFPEWDRYMQHHTGYDTRQLKSSLALAVVWYNHDPRHAFWPFLFELEFGIRTSIFIRNETTIRGGWLTLTTFFQSW